MEINQYLDATYLKTPNQSGLTESQTQEKVLELLKESLTYRYKLLMIRAKYIPFAKSFLTQHHSDTLIGTVIGFHEGTYSLKQKLQEARRAIELGADELDFVINYTEFKKGNIAPVEQEVLECSVEVLKHHKVVKWIIETAALTSDEVVAITELIKRVIIQNFPEIHYDKIYVKSSTGFYKTEKGIPNGATFENMKLIANHARPLKIKAAGGVRDYESAVKMIALGVDRIGTSSSKEICMQTHNTKSDY